VLDDVGGEALLVLDLHRVERAAVRVYADEKVVFRFQLGQRPSGFGIVCHRYLSPMF
jgi:hypothetical protein